MSPMRQWLVMGVMAVGSLWGTVLSADLSKVENAIPAAVKALGKPAMVDFPGGIQMAVSAASDEAQSEVIQGLNHLHGGWDFEASRHFAVAMREDPDCLLAHWGMVMSLLVPTPETAEAREAALDRMLALLDAGKGTEIERGYVYGLVKYLQEGPAAAGSAFRKVSAKFPNELQAAVFSALFSRGGYNVAGDATPDQEDAEKRLLGLAGKYPQSPVPLNALLLIRAEGPDLTGSLDLARKLCEMVPDYPPYVHMLGHYLWRCGKHAEAAVVFGRASALFQRWMKENKASLADCPEWLRADCYRSVSLASMGDYDGAYAAALQLAALPVPEDRLASPGVRFLLWDAKTLPARILLDRGLPETPIEASRSLPKTQETKAWHNRALACWWIDGLRFALEAQRMIEAGNLDDAKNVITALSQHGEAMAKTQKAAGEEGERSSWNRAFLALQVLASDVRGRFAMAGPIAKRETAYNWFSSAVDLQRPEPILNPPMLLTPMSTRLGGFFLTTDKPGEAIEAFQQALHAFPNNANALAGLKRAYEATGKTAEAEETQKKIEALRVKNE